MKNNQMPAAWKSAGQPKVQIQAKGQKVTARINMSAEVAGQGLCPDCNKQMIEAHACDIPVLACMPCRIVLPVEDTQEYKASLADKVKAQATV